MNKRQADMVAQECLFIVAKAKRYNPELYEYVADQLDLKDWAIDEAFKKLFPNG